MKTFFPLISLFVAVGIAMGASFDFASLPQNSWGQISTTGQYPSYGVETHLAFDTSGNAYMLGSCSYGGFAGGTHNNDIFRFNIKTGLTTKMYTCGTNPWPGGCQGGQVFDPVHNVIWFGPGNNSVCRTNGILWFPNQAYYGGFYKMTLPGGALEKVSDQNLGGGYYISDPVNNLVIGVAHNNYYGCRLGIYDIARDSMYSNIAPFNSETYTWRIPCTFDTKRGLLAITRWGTNTGNALKDFWFYNPASKVWSKKTPSAVPPMINVPLIYEPLSDKYLLIGTDEASSDQHPQVWEYDYGTNAWSEHPRGSRQYDATTPANSTWPPLRVYPGSFGFDAKNGVIANWGGLGTNGAGADGGKKQAIWVYKVSMGGGTALEGKRDESAYGGQGMKDESSIIASPNPFRGTVQLVLSGLAKFTGTVKIYTPSGRLVADLSGRVRGGRIEWDAAGFPPGLYLVTAGHAEKTVTQKIFLLN